MKGPMQAMIERNRQVPVKKTVEKKIEPKPLPPPKKPPIQSESSGEDFNMNPFDDDIDMDDYQQYHEKKEKQADLEVQIKKNDEKQRTELEAQGIYID